MTNEQKEKIIRFRRQGFGYADIGRELGISKNTVKSFCRRNGLMVSNSKPVDDRDRCRECGNPLVQQEKKKRRIFCCKACREKWWTEHADRIDRKAIYADFQLRRISASILRLRNFKEAEFIRNIERIVVTEDGSLEFHFYEGRTETWQRM